MRKHLGQLSDAERSLKKAEQEKVKTTGKVPFFHGRKEARKLLAQKSKEEEKTGSSRNKQEERREKKLAGREKKRLPSRRVKE
ncbi:unnamed protein product [Effrenium voratum]|nr:unnamed protein product [Effrenium voratum]